MPKLTTNSKLSIITQLESAMYTIKPIIDSTIKLEGPLTTMYHMRNIYGQQYKVEGADSTAVSAPSLNSSVHVDHIRMTPLLPSNTIFLQINNLLKVMDF